MYSPRRAFRLDFCTVLYFFSPSGRLWVDLGRLEAALWRLWAALGQLLGSSWGHLEPSWAHFWAESFLDTPVRKSLFSVLAIPDDHLHDCLEFTLRISGVRMLPKRPNYEQSEKGEAFILL